MPAGMVIVGAGECGARAALTLREKGYDGPVTLIGEEPHLPYERPPLSKDAMTAQTPAARTVADKERLDALAIDFIGHCPAAAIDRDAHAVTLADGRRIPYQKLLLATGAVPRRLRDAPQIRSIATLRTFDDALAIRSRLAPGKSVAIIGGGFIGLELASAARARGADVTLIEAQPRILMRGVPADIATVIHARHATAGVTLMTGQGIAGLEASDERATITLTDGRTLDADLVVVGIGAEPVTRLAQEAGLAIDNGIAVDDRLRTSDPDILAAGDCCSFPLAIYGGRRVRLEAWRNAQEHGALAAGTMLGEDIAHEAVPWFWSDQYELGLQIAGLSDEGQSVVRRDVGDGAFILFHLADDGRLVAASGIGPGTSVARDIRLAEMLIARRATPDAARLAAPDVKLKALLAG